MTTASQPNGDAPRYYAKALTNARRFLGAVQPHQWEASTPCTDWNVRQLVNHMVSTIVNAKSIVEGDGPQNLGDVLGDDPLAAFDNANAAALAAIRVPGAMEKTVMTRRGEQVAQEYVLSQVQEMLVHGWDLAKATGQDTTMDAELVDLEYPRAVQNRERMRGSGAWGATEPAVPENADTQTKYLALLGREA